MKMAVAGFLLLVGIVAISSMYRTSQVETSTQAQQADVARQARPRDLQLLKRPAVRSACMQHSDWEMEACRTIDRREVSIGMTAEQAQLAWGKPARINTTAVADGERDQWVYGDNYLYVDNGIVRSIQTSR